MKLLFCCWLVLPIFNGAAYIYEAHVRRYFKIGNYVSPVYNERQRRVLQMMSLDARKSVERYIETHGPQALDKIIRAVSFSSHPLRLMVLPFAISDGKVSFFLSFNLSRLKRKRREPSLLVASGTEGVHCFRRGVNVSWPPCNCSMLAPVIISC
jgi:hypothetical protein